MRTLVLAVFLALGFSRVEPLRAGATPTRSGQFQARSPAEARQWQSVTRERLFALMMGGNRPTRVPLQPQVLRRIDVPQSGYALEELSLMSLPDRPLHAWLAVPRQTSRPVGAVLALHGHGGSAEQVVQGLSLYWYGRALAEMGYVVIAPDIGPHELQHAHWSLMGERTWDSLRCLDYLVTRPEVDPDRIAVAGLSLGGETAMYVAALDERVKLTISSGWLTTVQNMKQGHCPCWNFPGLEEHFDFADIFACVAPRWLICELGEKERAPGGFPTAIGRAAFAEIQNAYRVLKAADHASLTLHPAGHVFNGRDFWPLLSREFDVPSPWAPAPDRSLPELLRRGEIARRCFSRAWGVFEGWWATRDPVTGLFPRRLDQPVWAPNDNAADMLPFLALTTYYLAPHRLDEVLQVIPVERQLTTRLAGLPDWYALTNRAFLHPAPDTNRSIFCAAEYCKDGLLPMTEVMGNGVWTDRMFELIDAIFAQAPVESDFGLLPANDTEVNGEILQVLSRLYFRTRDPRYLQWAERIGDAYCLEVLPHSGYLPAYRWDFKAHRALADEFNLNDHGNEIVGGLSELYVATTAGHPAKATAYRTPLLRMGQTLLDNARNPDGFWVQRIQSSTGRVLDPATPDTWGYALSGLLTLSQAAHTPMGTKATLTAFAHLNRPQYLDWSGADSYADSIEGALVLLNRLPSREVDRWLDRILPIFLGRQLASGIVEGWYGDGNYARTALMAGLYLTQGVRPIPWNPSLQLGADLDHGRLRLALSTPNSWQGRLVFDTPRHLTHLRLPINYPRLNEFPEWFTVDDVSVYSVTIQGKAPETLTGAQLRTGLALALNAGGTLSVEIQPFPAKAHD